MSDAKVAAATGNGVSFGGLLAILFIALKLTGVIAWSWWWVLSPLWIPVALAIGVLVFAFVCACAAGLFAGRRK